MSGEKLAHKQVAEVAKAMATAEYEELMKRNEWYEIWRKQNPRLSPEALCARWVARRWFNLVPQARATMAEMLTHNHPESLKEQILDALILDAEIRRDKRVRRLLH